MFVVRYVFRRFVPELAIVALGRPARAARVALLATAIASLAVRASVAQSMDARHFTPHTPTVAVHTDFIVETNRKGQVTRVRPGKPCPDLAFNAMTYGNALQAFIRTTDGRAISGTYRLSYQFNPLTKMVRRSVALIRAGGVDPNRESAVEEMADIARRQPRTLPKPAVSANPLPSLHEIIR